MCLRLLSCRLPAQMLLLVMAGPVGLLVADPPAAGQPGFAVVELFTSESCSSCPNADHLLNDLVLEARANGTAVYALAFHVDYWNRLQTGQGVWVDSFSHRGCTIRQTFYLPSPEPGKRRNLATPQMIVNGKAVRADRQSLDAAVADALSTEATNRLELKATQADDTLDIAFTCDDGEGMFLMVALVERDLKSEVTAGENAGRTFIHENVVRGFAASKPERETGAIRMKIPPQVRLENASLIGFLQRPDDRTMRAAAQVDLATVLPASADRTRESSARVGKSAPAAVPTPILSGTCADGQCVLPLP